MKDFTCPKCNSKDLFTKENGNQVGLYCGDCGKWIKWISKEELRMFDRQQKLSCNNNNNIRCAACDYSSDKKEWGNLSIQENIKVCPKCSTLKLVE